MRKQVNQFICFRNFFMSYNFFKRYFLLFGAIVLCIQIQTFAKSNNYKTAEGVFYSMEGGTGSGSITLLSKKRKLIIDYTNPRTEFGFKNEKGFEIGAVWKVHYSIEKYDDYMKAVSGKQTYLDLTDMTFTGRFDWNVHSANELIQQHYFQLARGEFQNAYKNLSKSFQSHHSYKNFVKGFGDVIFEKNALPSNQVSSNYYMQFSVPYYATSFVEISSKTAIIDVPMSRFTNSDSNYYRFYLIREKNAWRINKVKEISIDKYYEND